VVAGDLDSRRGAVAAFIGVLERTGEELDAAQLRARLVARGLDAAAVGAAWRLAGSSVRRQAGVCYDPVRRTYRAGEPSAANALSAEEALDRLLPPRLSARRGALAEAVRSAVRERDELEATLRAAHAQSAATATAQRRQAQLDAVRALADVVGEVEELAAAGADVRVVAQRVRALAEAFGLTPVGRAGEATAFDPARHETVGTRPPGGVPVLVLRPGYVARLRSPAGGQGPPDDQPAGWADVLVSRTQVVWHGRG
jgi:hypothetical protein